MRRLALTLGAIALLGCGGARLPLSETEGTTPTPLVGACEAGDPIELTDHQQVERELYVEVRHGGGCERHTYVACLEDPHPSEPQIYRLTVHHDAHGDACRGEVTQVLHVSLDRDITATRLAGGVITLE